MENRSADLPIGTTRADELNGSHTIKDKARSRAHELAGEAKGRARHIASEQKERATSELAALASALRDAGAQLDSENHLSGRLLRSAADRIDRLSERVDGGDIDNLMRDARIYARNNPALFLGGAIALGFAASRFFKAASADGYDSSIDFDGSGLTPSGYDATPGDLERPFSTGATGTSRTTAATDATAGGIDVDPLTGARDGGR